MADQSDFVIERYKYVLSRKHALNEATFKIAAIYQTAVGAIAFGGFSLLGMGSEKKLPPQTLLFVIDGLVALLGLVSLLSILLLVSGISSWVKYKSDESILAPDVVLLTNNADHISKKIAFLSWYETYIIAIIGLTFLATVLCHLLYIRPYFGSGI